MCCGHKRKVLRTLTSAPPVQRRPIHRTQTGVPAGNVTPALASVRYVRRVPLRLTGEATGRTYEFSSARPTQHVDPRDLAGLLRTGYFSRAK
jgi:hypothetical protein